LNELGIGLLFVVWKTSRGRNYIAFLEHNIMNLTSL